MEKSEQQIKEALEYLADARVQMDATGRVLASLLLAGAIPSKELVAYNYKAAEIFNLEASLISFLKENGVNGLPDAPPFPVVFAYKGLYGSAALFPATDSLPEFATTDDFSVLSSAVSPINSNEEFKQFTFDDQGLGAITALAWIAIAGVACFTTYKIFEKKYSTDLAREAIRQDAKTKSEWMAQRRYESELRFEVYTKCISSSGVVDYARCVATAEKLVKDTPMPSDYRKYLGNSKTEEANNFFWWVGVVTSVVALTAGVIYIYRRRKKKQLTT